MEGSHSVCICLGHTRRPRDGRHRKSTRSPKSKAANECIKLDWTHAVSVSGRIIMNRDEWTYRRAHAVRYASWVIKKQRLFFVTRKHASPSVRLYKRPSRSHTHTVHSSYWVQDLTHFSCWSVLVLISLHRLQNITTFNHICVCMHAQLYKRLPWYQTLMHLHLDSCIWQTLALHSSYTGNSTRFNTLTNTIFFFSEKSVSN